MNKVFNTRYLVHLVLAGLFSFLVFNLTYAVRPSDYDLKEGDTTSASGSDDPDVYIINEHGYKRLFLNPVIFNFYGHLGGFAKVKAISPSTRDAFITSGLFRNCEANDEKVYGLESTGEDTSILHWINTTGAQAVIDDPNFFKKVFCINNNEFNWYLKGSDYNSVNQIPVYSRDTTSTSTVRVGIIEFVPQNVVYGDVHYAYLKKTSGCWLSSGGEIGNYYWVSGSNQSIHSSDCYDILETYSFLDIFNNLSKGISKNVQRTIYGEEDTMETLHSVYYIKDFYEKEALKYGVSDLAIDIDVKGPYMLASDPPLGGRWGVGEGVCNASLTEFFVNEAISRVVDESQYDVIAYVYLGDWQLSGRSYEGFTSCATGSKSFMTVTTWRLPQEDEGVVTLAHELGHSFGASDYYTSPCPQNPTLWSCVKDPEGIPEPNKIPKYPQTKGCLMAQIIAYNKPGSDEAGDATSISNLNQAVICDATAREFGWR